MRGLLILVAIVIAAALPAQAQNCRPTAETHVFFLPLGPEIRAETARDLAELDDVARQVGEVVPLVSPNLGFLQFPTVNIKLDRAQRTRDRGDGRGCVVISRVDYSFGYSVRSLIVAREFAGDPCLDRWLHAGLARLEAWEDDTIAWFAPLVGEPLQERLRDLRWTGLESVAESESFVNDFVSQSVMGAIQTMVGTLQAGRVAHFAEMEQALAGVCGGRGAALLAALKARPL